LLAIVAIPLSFAFAALVGAKKSIGENGIRFAAGRAAKY
jgi:hypothetical protein